MCSIFGVELRQLEKETESRQQQLKKYLNIAESIAPLTPELESEFRKMPTTIEDLNTAIRETIFEAGSIFTPNSNALEEYEGRQQKVLVLFLHLALHYVDMSSEVTVNFQIEELAAELAAEEEKHGRSNTEIEEIKVS
ncbi:hypothetical protein PIB30_033272 [Stylosanthes scabra]|uniref:Uncharacterized protein n=1 Tax=Stylosanthes scabra TaxID=79078 RepID=A0ABU6ZC66_9FABA|nr:hypothetical protein [Stylosanthes scabra]